MCRSRAGVGSYDDETNTTTTTTEMTKTMQEALRRYEFRFHLENVLLIYKLGRQLTVGAGILWKVALCGCVFYISRASIN